MSNIYGLKLQERAEIFVPENFEKQVNLKNANFPFTYTLIKLLKPDSLLF